MRDIHCHILPGVDDGAADLDESLAMLEAAKRAGVTRIVCTPHCRDPYFDYDKMWDAFELLRDNADGFPLQMGFEVNHRKLVELGIDAAEHLHFDGTNAAIKSAEAWSLQPISTRRSATPTCFYG